MFGIQLKIVPTHSPVKLAKPRLKTISRALNFSRKTLTPKDGVTGSFTSVQTVVSGKVVGIDLTGDGIARHRIELSGSQTVRAIFLGRADDPIADVYVAGTKTIEAPPRARRAVFIGEGSSLLPPLAGRWYLYLLLLTKR